jgi:NADPH-dependent curcumin reductase CurA
MSVITSREIRLHSRPQGRPNEANFELATVELPSLREGDVLVRNTYLSVDPCMFCRMQGGKSFLPAFELGKAMEGGAVGTVIQSRSKAFTPGDIVISNFGWRKSFVAPSKSVRHVTSTRHPLSEYLEDFGLQNICSWASSYFIHVRPDGALLVSGGASVEGSVASQLAKLRGCRIIGSAGSRDMLSFLRDDCGFDIAFDYKAGPILQQLRDVPLLSEDKHDTSLEAALGVCMVGSIIAETTPGVLKNGRVLPLPIYFLSQAQGTTRASEDVHLWERTRAESRPA